MADSIFEWGWWVTIGDAISGGSPNEILFADWSTNVAQSSDLFFDATQKIFRVWDISWTSNWVTFVLDDTIPAIKSMFADGIGTFEISWTGGNRLFLATVSNWSFQAWDVDLASWGALLLVNSTFWEVKNVWDYYRFSPTGALFDYLFEINSSAKTTKIWDVAGIANSTLLTVDDTNTKITINKRFETAKWANIAAANDLTLGWDWNLFTITGNTQINAITTANRQAGSMITLIFTGTPTVKHNTAWWAGTAVLFLAGSLDLVAANNTVLGLIYDGTQRQETFRKVA